MNNIQNAIGERFTLMVCNNTTTAKKIGILNGIFEMPYDISTNTKKALETAGFFVEPLRTWDTTQDPYGAADKLTSKSDNTRFSIEQFQAYLQKQGKKVRKLIVMANHSDVFTQSIEMVNYTPLSGNAIQSFSLNDFFSTYQNQTNKIEINFEQGNGAMNLDFSTLLQFNLGAGREIRLTFIF
ncbi:MAG: hypothetical protein PHP31_07610 [Lentimicrobiaceae bacterium]|nr:hypothetical protein [Lentimicrobiaceae bacterium]